MAEDQYSPGHTTNYFIYCVGLALTGNVDSLYAFAYNERVNSFTHRKVIMKNYFGFARDHSGSMTGLARNAARDYNENIASIKEEALAHGIDTIVSVVELGYGDSAEVRTVISNSSVIALAPISDSEYTTRGRGTPLFDAVGSLIEQMKAVPDANDPDVSFLVFVTTDGAENASTKYSGSAIAKMIKELQATDRWTFVFRVPRGDASRLTQYGIPAGNIQEWDQSQTGMATSTASTKSAFKGYYAARAAGVTSTDKFYADLSTVSLSEVKANLVDISKEVDVYVVGASNDGVQIRDFVEAQGVTYTKGCAFYELSKTETVQATKMIAIRDKVKGAVYSGQAARDLLGVPHHSDVKLAPGQHGQYEIFVQSTSFNRKLVKGTNLMVWTAITV